MDLSSTAFQNAQEQLMSLKFDGERSKMIQVTVPVLHPCPPLSADPGLGQLTAACELFARHVTRTALDIGDFDACKKRLIERGERFAEQVPDPSSPRTRAIRWATAFAAISPTFLSTSASTWW